MTGRSLTLLFRVSLLGLMCASLSGCLIDAARGHLTVGLANHPGSGPATVQGTANLSSNAAASWCSGSGSTFDCFYIVGGQTEESLVDLDLTGLASKPAGKFRFLIDPLILEVPAGVISAAGTYDTGSGPQPLPIGRANSFAVQPGTRITAEAGTTFLLLDLPTSVTSGLPISNPAAAPVFSYTLTLVQNMPPTMTVKPMLAGSLTILWQTYYVPVLPCVSDFASIPAITIPQASSPQNLMPSLLDLINNHGIGPCNHKLYDFTNAVPPVGLLFLPLVRH